MSKDIRKSQHDLGASILQMQSTAQASTQKAIVAVADAAGVSEVANTNLASMLDMLGAQSSAAITRAQTARTNIDRITNTRKAVGGVIAPIVDLMGAFNPEWNRANYRTQLNTEYKNVQRIRHQAQSAEDLAKRQITEATAQADFAVQQAGLQTTMLSQASQGVQLFDAVMRSRKLQEAVALEDLTDVQLAQLDKDAQAGKPTDQSPRSIQEALIARQKDDQLIELGALQIAAASSKSGAEQAKLLTAAEDTRLKRLGGFSLPITKALLTQIDTGKSADNKAGYAVDPRSNMRYAKFELIDQQGIAAEKMTLGTAQLAQWTDKQEASALQADVLMKQVTRLAGAFGPQGIPVAREPEKLGQSGVDLPFSNINLNTLPLELRVATSVYQQSIITAEATGQTDIAIAATARYDKVVQGFQTAQIESAPEKQRPAMQQFFATGTVNTISAAAEYAIANVANFGTGNTRSQLLTEIWNNLSAIVPDIQEGQRSTVLDFNQPIGKRKAALELPTGSQKLTAQETWEKTLRVYRDNGNKNPAVSDMTVGTMLLAVANLNQQFPAGLGTKLFSGLFDSSNQPTLEMMELAPDAEGKMQPSVSYAKLMDVLWQRQLQAVNNGDLKDDQLMPNMLLAEMQKQAQVYVANQATAQTALEAVIIKTVFGNTPATLIYGEINRIAEFSRSSQFNQEVPQP